MPKKQCKLVIPQLEHFPRQTLLVASLTEDAEFLEPLAHASGMPAVSVAADEQLMPLAAAGVALHGATHFFSSSANGLAVRFRCGCIAQWRIVEVTAIADQLTKKNQLVIS